MILTALLLAGSDAPPILMICAALTIAIVFYVFYLPPDVDAGEDKTRLVYLKERKEVVYDNLRDLNFEYKAGKYPEADYQQARQSLEDEAAALLAEIEQLEKAAPKSLFRNVPGLNRSKQKGV
jgi:hypothetical protein